MRWHQSWCSIEGGVSPGRGVESPPSSAAHSALNAAQDRLGLQVTLSFWSANIPKSFSSGLPLVHSLPSMYLCFLFRLSFIVATDSKTFLFENVF